MVILGTIAVFASVSFGVAAVRQSGARAPDTIQVEGRPYSLDRGKYFLFFFHPACSHCLAAAKRLAGLTWNETQVIAIPVEQPQFADGFLSETGLHAIVTSDFEKLKAALGYTAYPFGAAVVNGRAKATLTNFETADPAEALRPLGLVK